MCAFKASTCRLNSKTCSFLLPFLHFICTAFRSQKNKFKEKFRRCILSINGFVSQFFSSPLTWSQINLYRFLLNKRKVIIFISAPLKFSTFSDALLQSHSTVMITHPRQAYLTAACFLANDYAMRKHSEALDNWYDLNERD